MSERARKQQDELVANLATNLRDLVAFYPSVSEVCRKIDINRQQFNKYLAGLMMPSLHNLRRISDFFGVDEAELTLPHSDFRKMVFARQLQERLPMEFAMMLRRQGASIKDTSAELEPYLGWYHSYVRSPSYKNRIVRDITIVYRSGDYVFSKSLNQSARRIGGKTVSKNNGFVFWQDQRIYLFEQQGTISILYPSTHQVLSSLQGILIGVGQDANRRIFSTKLIMDYLGKTTNVRQAIAASGIFGLDDTAVDAEIRSELQEGLMLA